LIGGNVAPAQHRLPPDAMTDLAGLVAVPARRWLCWCVGWLWLDAVRQFQCQAGIRV